MPIEVRMPPLSQTMDTLVLVEWLKQPGSAVAKGEPLFVVETDKATLEVESPATGILQCVLAAPGDEIAAKTPIAVIAAPDELSTHAAAPDPQSTPAAAETMPAAPRPAPDTLSWLPAERQERIFASPRARQLAASERIALNHVRPTGPNGLIVERDIITAMTERTAANATQQVAPTPDSEPTPQPLSPMRRTIAQRLHQSQTNAVPVTLMREVDATPLVELRTQLLTELNGDQVRPSYTDFLIAISARCLLRHPYLNGTTDGQSVLLFDAVHMALAVDTARGLLSPVLRSVQGQGVLALAAERSRLVSAAQAGTLNPPDFAGGTFTLTNLGPQGVDAFTPVINPPQIAILGAGRIRAAAAVHQGQLAIRQLLMLSLTFDHRVVDGAPAARYLHDVAQLIENPQRIWL